MSYLRNELAHHNQLGQWQAAIGPIAQIFGGLFGKKKATFVAYSWAGNAVILPIGKSFTFGNVLKAIRLVSTSWHVFCESSNPGVCFPKSAPPTNPAGAFIIWSAGDRNEPSTIALMGPTQSGMTQMLNKINIELKKFPAKIQSEILATDISSITMPLDTNYQMLQARPAVQRGWQYYQLSSGMNPQDATQQAVAMLQRAFQEVLTASASKIPTPTPTTPTTPVSLPPGVINFVPPGFPPPAPSPTILLAPSAPTEAIQPTVIQEAGMAGGPLFWVALAVGAGLFIMNLGEDKPRRRTR